MLGTQTSPQGLTAATRAKSPAYATNSKAGKNTVSRTTAGAIADYKRDHCVNMGIGIGPRLHAECPFAVTAREFQPDGSEALAQVINAAYRQVFGNLPPTDNQRCTSLEARLLNGEISVRDFVNGLAKSDFYKDNYFHAVGPQRGIELNFKHLLGRAPLNQDEIAASIQLQAESGFDALVDSLTDSAEYTEVFGSDSVPYNRTSDSYAGMYTLSFKLMRELNGTKVAISDNVNGRNSRTTNPLAQAARRPATATATSFSYAKVYKVAPKLPQQKYTGHNPPKAKEFEPFRPFGVHF